MRIIEQLVYKITGDNKEYDKSLDNSEKSTKKFGDVANKIFAGVTVAAIAMTVKKLGEMAIASATALDRVDKMSQKIGISRQSFQEWDFILSQSGASVDGLQMSLKTLATATEQADRGSKEYVDTFEQLGVSIYDTNGELKNQEELFNEVFVALANTENQTKRTALASALLGRSATELAPAMNAGGEAIEAMRNKAHDLGLVLGDELVDQGVILTDNIDQMKRAFGAWRTEALAPVIGVLVTITDKLLNQKTATSEMAGVLDTIKTKTAEYKEISDQLVNTQNKLSDAERDLLLARKETLGFEINRQLLQLATSYGKTTEKISDLEDAVLRQNDNVKEQQRILRSLNSDSYDYELQQSVLAQALIDQADAQEELSNAQISYNRLIAEASKLIADGVLDVEALADVNSELYDQLIAGADAIDKEREAIEKARTTFEMLGDLTEEELRKIIEQNKARTDSAYYMELVRLAEEQLANVVDDTTNAIEENTEAVAENTSGYNDAQKAFDEWVKNRNEKIRDTFNQETKARADAYKLMESYRQTDHEKAITTIQKQAQAFLQAGVDRVDVAKWQSEQIQGLIKEEENAWIESLKNIAENGFKNFVSGFEAIGQAIGEGADVWKAFQAMGLEALASIIEGLGHELSARAIISALALDWGGAGLATAGAIAAYTGAGLLRSQIPAYEVGSIRIPETQEAVVHRNEMILPAPIAEQARQEGISIAPSGGGSGNTTFMIYLDGKKIAENTVGHVNSGVYRIDARVVK